MGAITGFIAGTGHKPLVGACVIASGPSGQAMAMTRPDGRYTLTALRPGKYTLHYSDCSAPGRYLDQWSGGRFVPDGAASIVVAAGRVRNAGRVTLHAASSMPAGVNVAGPNSALALPGPTHAGTSATAPGTGAIAGKVTGKGKPLKGICVDVFPRRGGRGARVKTTKSGTYRAGSLKPGRYLVVFFDCTRKTNWLGQYYRGVEFYSSHRRPTAVPVRAGKTTGGINASLELGGEIDGTVLNKDGQALPGICVEAIGRIGKRFVFGGFKHTDARGRYVLHGVTPATYQVHFSRCGNPGNYAPVWWRHSQTMSGATKIVIKSGTVARHIDPVMPTGGVISGTVRAVGPSGKRLRGICVFAEGHSAFSYEVTNRSGNYRLIGLTTGKYRLFFQRCRNRGNYLPTRRSARAILGHTLSGFNAYLRLGAIGTGVVTDSHGDPVAGICVQFSGHRSFGGTRTRSDGTYSVNALRSGPYKIQFTGGCGNSGSYAPQFYKGATNIAAAKQIHLTAGKTTGRINASMRPGATIAGLVTDSAGNRLNDVCVSIVPLAGLPFGFDFTNLTFAYRGAYAAENLAPGMYAVNFGCFFAGRQLAPQWFMAQPGPSTANLVSAPAGVTTSGIDATLPQNGSMTGTVTDRSGRPLAGICVEARVAGSSGTEYFFYGQTFTNTRKNGTYSLSRMAPGTYVIQYVDCRHGTYGSRWYKQKASPQSGTPVTVASGETTSGIDETLAPGGSIAGVVKTSSGMPIRACVEAFDATTESDRFVIADRTGHYTIPGLSTGSYQVTFYPCGRSKTPLAEAVRPTPVAVKAPAAVTGINGTLGVAGSIAGAVRSRAGQLQASVCVAAVPADPGNGIAVAETGQNGTYKIGQLGAGTYHVYVGDAFCGGGSSGHVFAPEWFDGQQSEATATDVTVTAGNATTGINARLGEGGTIRGAVAHQGQPVAGECVTAVPVNPTPDPLFNLTLNPVVAVTTSSGTYSLVDLLPGQYHVKFSIGCGDSGFATQWWQNVSSEQSATTISVSANGTVTGIDANLP
ncbi:MAG TPA: carboxypeptidase-like regulatory domain-containing protein [Streptosporangiaceae bacterium]